MTSARRSSPGSKSRRVISSQSIFTIGHSTRSIGEFIGMLKAHGVKRLVDVRTIPRSRHNPQFSSETLAQSLAEARIGYTHLPRLGGLRKTSSASKNQGWRNASFRGFADYMQTSEFEAGLGKLIELSKKKLTAVMCAEAVPWRCHRSLIADALKARGIAVEHIMSTTKRQRHKMTPFARRRGRLITYPAPKASRRKVPKSDKGAANHGPAKAESSSIAS